MAFLFALWIRFAQILMSLWFCFFIITSPLTTTLPYSLDLCLFFSLRFGAIWLFVLVVVVKEDFARLLVGGGGSGGGGLYVFF